MVALNWQKPDTGMILNEGMFAGEHGWVLKPPGYRSDTTEPMQYSTLDLKITVYAGQHIPMSPHTLERNFHPYIKCELHIEKEERELVENGARGKEAEYKRRIPYQKGDHPDYGEDGCVLTFPTIPNVVEELSFVRYVPVARYPSFLPASTHFEGADGNHGVCLGRICFWEWSLTWCIGPYMSAARARGACLLLLELTMLA